MTVNQKIAWSILAAIGILTLLTLIAVYLMIGIAWQDFQRSAARRNPPEPSPAGSTLVRYALALKCPRCGQGKISSSVLQMNQACPACGVVFWKNDGEWMGPAVINYSVALAGALAAWAVLVMFNFSALAQVVLSALATVAAVVAVTPWSRSFWTLFLYLNGELGTEKQS
ncbi:MAG TPA: DUF983 domain-containing protein [Candidatus Binataceae bacterium]|nr:DUF983 domain-containing protein [Candidatus Binataceae bacterium]